MCEDNLVKL